MPLRLGHWKPMRAKKGTTASRGPWKIVRPALLLGQSRVWPALAHSSNAGRQSVSICNCSPANRGSGK